MIKNKKAQIGHGIVWFYKIVMLVLVIGGIVGAIYVHYSKQYDIRELESGVLASKIIDCFSEQGKIKNSDFTIEKLDSCLEFDEEEIFVNITLIENEKSIFLGKGGLLFYCEAIEQGVKGKKLPSCFNENYNITYDNTPEQMKIFIAILKSEKNV
jgi:hypothetical protein